VTVYGVRQRYCYTYTGPVTDVRQRLIMIPPDAYGEQCLRDYSLEVAGADGVTLTWDADPFGNRVCRVAAASVATAIEFVARFEVERRGPTGPLPVREDAARPFLAPTALTAPDARLREVADRVRAAVGPDPVALSVAVGEWAAGAIRYEFGVTGVQTPAAMALALGRGVCQDYAHLALTVLRLTGVAGRYVSGHLLGEGAPHAWYEALLPDPAAPGRLRVASYDPTHRRAAGASYITVAVGRDYADVAPTSGSFSGRSAGRLSATKDAWVLEAGGRQDASRQGAA